METSRVPEKAKKITVQQLITVILVLFIFFVVLFQVKYFWQDLEVREKQANPDIKEPPEYLFSIYGNEEKPLKQPMGIFVADKGTIFVSSTGNHEIQAFDSKGKYKYSFGQKGSEPGKLMFPYGITQTAEGNLLISETGNGRIQEFTPDGEFSRVFFDKGSKVGVDKPGPLVFQDNRLYIGDLVRQKIVISNPEGTSVEEVSGVNYPHGIAIDKQGNLLVSDSGGYRLAVFDKGGNLIKSISEWSTENKFSMLRGVAIDSIGRIYVADTLISVIRIFDNSGKYLYSIGGKGFENGQMLYPTALFVDGNNRLYIADWGNNRVEVWGYSN